MSELKAFDVGLGRYAEDGSPCIVAFDADQNPRLLNEQIYLKADADKVIAELEAENEKLRGESCKLTDGCLRLKQCRKEKANIADELCHSNHKRCLAMADMNWLQANRYSAAEMVERIRGNFEESTQCSKLEEKYLKRYNKWLALAEEPTWAKFLQLIHKEAK